MTLASPAQSNFVLRLNNRQVPAVVTARVRVASSCVEHVLIPRQFSISLIALLSGGAISSGKGAILHRLEVLSEQYLRANWTDELKRFVTRNSVLQ